jgi:hypothetical protein
MEDLGLFEAWSRWWDGQQLSGHRLYGCSILVIGRFGKFLAFIAGLAIVAELFGAQKLRSYGQSLHRQFTWASAWEMVRTTFAWTRDMIRLAVLSFQYSQATRREAGRLTTERDQLTDKLKQEHRWKTALSMLLGTLLTVLLFDAVVGDMAVQYVVIYFTFGAIFLTLCVSPVVILAVQLLLAVTGWLIDVAVIEPFAWVLEREKIVTYVQAASVLLLVVGFLLDMLAS